jgi:molybdopterin converting factor subunit 1
MTVLYFAHARRATGVSEEKIPLSTSLTATEFWDLIVQRHPALAALRTSSRLARENDFLPSDARISIDDEIAIIPPVSGG